VNRELPSAVEIDACLRAGGLVVTASERAARFLTSAFHRARRAEGLTAWPAPHIQDWRSFVRTAWDERSLDGRLVLNTLQEQSLWAGIVAESGHSAAQLEGPRYRLANLAMEAHNLLCDYAPRLLKQSARIAWQQDAAEYSAWLAAFDETCTANNLIGSARLPLELIEALERERAARPPLLLAGFDRILPTQRRLFDAWGSWIEAPLAEPARRIEFHHVADPASELAACALWCKRQLAVHPHARLLVVTQDVLKRRGEIERAFLRFLRTDGNAFGSEVFFEFSLGVQLGQIALARGARLLLHWLDSHINEHDLDWLLSTGQAVASAEESRALTAFMRALRRCELQRTRWTLDEFLRQTPGEALPAAWIARMTQAQQRLQEVARCPKPPLVWAELAPQLLEIVGWPGARPLASIAFQALRSWQQAMDDCASLGFDGSRMKWTEFMGAFERAVNDSLFAPESQDAPILIAGPAESAGLSGDAIWFLGASEDAWPASGATHPLLPLDVQREARMPHATPQLDWELAATMTRRLLASAPEVHFSYAKQSEGIDARPSRLIEKLAGPPQDLPAELLAPAVPEPQTVIVKDFSCVPFPAGHAAGGSSVLTSQSQCPFKAFATARLGAQDWEAAEAGLTEQERGMLLHEVLHSIWGGPPDGISTQKELLQNPEGPRPFVGSHVRKVLREKLPERARESMPKRYLELEETRLVDLVTEWLKYEAARVPFAVVGTEKQADVSIAGLTLKLRLDRIDRLNDGSLLVIDYKSGNVSPTCWDLPRPDDVQLPLYAGFALPPGEELGGLVFAKLHPGERNREFAGRVRHANETLLNDLNLTKGLVRNILDDEDLGAWRAYIVQMARNFLAGRAEVDPRDYPDTCKHCGLQALCRIQENQPESESDESEDGEETDDA
jgi:probable DNA repair protein